jgi:hypothetical protein
MKLSEQYEDLAREIKVLKKISKTNKEENTGVPQLLDYGLVLLTNMA